MTRFRPLAFLALLLFASAAQAEGLGVSLAGGGKTPDGLRKGLEQAAQDSKTLIDVEDAGGDAEQQLAQLQGFIVAGVDALIVQPVKPSDTAALTQLANTASLPLVFVNREPTDAEQLRDRVVYVGANEAEAATLQAQELCRREAEAGKNPANILVMSGDLSDRTAAIRSRTLKDVIGRKDCNQLKILDEQSAVGDQAKAQDLMSNWLVAGFAPDAVVAQNDAMALGIIAALKAQGLSPASVIVTGVDATPEALAAVKAGDLAATVFQDAYTQGTEAVRSALNLVRGEPLPPKTYTGTRLITAVNADFVVAPN